MTNTVLFDLQAAAMAAAANSANPGRKLPNGEDIPEGMNFSDILASQNVQNTQNMQTNAAENAEGKNIPAENAETDAAEETDKGIFSDALKLIENADDGVKKALELLLKTVLNALRGPSGGEERKTDMFMILTDGSSGFSNEDDMLLGAEIMNRLGLMLDAEIEKETDPDLLLGELEKIVEQILGVSDEDADETTAADALAALLNIAPEDVESFAFEGSGAKTEAVGNAAEAMKTPIKAVEQAAPEKLPEAEKLYSELAAEIVSETEDVPKMASRTGFTALKINNASEQVGNIERKLYSESEAEAEEMPVRTIAADRSGIAENSDANKDSGSESKSDGGNRTAAEIAAGTSAENQTVFVRDEIGTESTETKLSADTAFSVENQVKDVVADEIAGFGDKDGVKELVLILRPRELGQIAVKLVKDANTVSVIMSAQYEEVGKLMTQRAAYLGESLAGKDYDVKEVQIVEPGNAAEQMGLNFTDHGFSFARNQGGSNDAGSGRSYSGENDGYGEIDGIEEISADHGDIRFREAKLWTTA